MSLRLTVDQSPAEPRRGNSCCRLIGTFVYSTCSWILFSMYIVFVALAIGVAFKEFNDTRYHAVRACVIEWFETLESLYHASKDTPPSVEDVQRGPWYSFIFNGFH